MRTVSFHQHLDSKTYPTILLGLLPSQFPDKCPLFNLIESSCINLVIKRFLGPDFCCAFSLLPESCALRSRKEKKINNPFTSVHLWIIWKLAIHWQRAALRKANGEEPANFRRHHRGGRATRHGTIAASSRRFLNKHKMETTWNNANAWQTFKNCRFSSKFTMRRPQDALYRPQQRHKSSVVHHSKPNFDSRPNFDSYNINSFWRQSMTVTILYGKNKCVYTLYIYIYTYTFL